MAIKDILDKVSKRIVTAAVFLSSFNGTSAFSQSRPKADILSSDKKEVVSDDAKPQSVRHHQMKPGKLETGSSKLDAHIAKMREAGAFYLDYNKYKKSKDAETSVVYLTNDEIKELGIHKLPITPFAVSLARENWVMWEGSEWHNPEARQLYEKQRNAAACKIKGTFYGEFQLTPQNTAKAILYGMVQYRNPELQKFCRQFAKPGVKLEKNPSFQHFLNKYLDAVTKFDNGEGSRQELMSKVFGWTADEEFNKPQGGVFSIIDYSKENFHKLSLSNPLMSRAMQETFLVNVYMALAVESEKIRQNLDPMFLGPYIAATVYMPNSNKHRAIVFDENLTPEEKRAMLIDVSGRPTKADARMREAQTKVYNKGFYCVDYCLNYAWIVDSREWLESFLGGVQKIAMKSYVQQYKAERLINKKLLDGGMLMPEHIGARDCLPLRIKMSESVDKATKTQLPKKMFLKIENSR